MTAPIYQGTPDFVRSQPYSDQVLINDNTITDALGIDYGPFYVGNIRALYLFCTSNTNFTTVQLNWRTAQVGGVVIEAQAIDIGSPQSLRKSFRPFGPWLGVSVTAPIGLTTSYQIILSTVSDLYVPRFTVNSVIGVSLVAANIGAGATVITPATVGHIGEAFFEGFMQGGNWVIQTEVVNPVGSAVAVSRSTNNSGAFNKHIYIPTGKVQIRATNFSAAAQLYDTQLTFKPDAQG